MVSQSRPPPSRVPKAKPSAPNQVDRMDKMGSENPIVDRKHTFLASSCAVAPMERFSSSLFFSLTCINLFFCFFVVLFYFCFTKETDLSAPGDKTPVLNLNLLIIISSNTDFSIRLFCFKRRKHKVHGVLVFPPHISKMDTAPERFAVFPILLPPGLLPFDCCNEASKN